MRTDLATAFPTKFNQTGTPLLVGCGVGWAVATLDVVVERMAGVARTACHFAGELFNGHGASRSVHFVVANVVVEGGVHVAPATN